MEIDIIISCDDIKEEKIKGKTVVIVDMLRATSVITTALDNGCIEVIPVIDVDEARNIAKNNKEKYVLGGERKALKIEGFDFSNSPLEYLEGAAEDKILVISTTNGTKAINRAISADKILIGAMINAYSVAEKIVELGKDVVIINSGTNGHYSLDDFICSGYITECILKKVEAKLTDIAFTAHYIYSQNKDVKEFIKNAKHYKVLKELGLEDDLQYCCRKDIIKIVPQFINGKITVK